MGDDKAQRHRGPRHIRPTYIQQPSHRIKRRNHAGIQILRRQPFGHGGALGLAGNAGELHPMRHRDGRRWRGAVGPYGVDGICRHRHQLDPGFLGCPDPGLCMQPGIIANLSVFRGVCRQPFGGAGGGNALVFIQRAVHLIAHLQRIAPIDENCGLLCQHHRRPRRSAETGQPFQPLGIGADIFAHVLI